MQSRRENFRSRVTAVNVIKVISSSNDLRREMSRSVYSVTGPDATSRFNPFNVVKKFAAVAIVAASVLLGTAAMAGATITPVTPVTVSAGVVYVSWHADATATSYAVTSSPSSAGCTVSVPLGTTSIIGCTVSGLTDGTAYLFTITPTAPTTTTATAVTLTTFTPALPVQNVVASQAGAYKAAVSFTADGVATSYTVTANDGPADTCPVGSSSGALTGTQTCIVIITDTGTGSPYTFTVTPNSGDTASSAGTSTPTVINSSNNAAAPTVKVTAPGVVALSFAANGLATQYVVSDAVGGSCTVGNGTSAPLGLQTCNISGLSQTTHYVFTVTGLGGGSTTTWTPTSSAAYPFALATPVATNSGNGKVTVTFTADGAATLYTVSAGAGTDCAVGNTSTPPTGTQSCTVTGLTAGSSYTFTVHANDGSTDGTTGLFTAATAIGAPTLVSAGNGSVTVQFTANGTATNYVVSTNLAASPFTLETNICTQVVAAATSSALQCTVTGLTPGTAYTFSVAPSGGTNTEVASAASGPFTAGGSSSTPVVALAGADKLSVSWLANGTATQYTASDGFVSCQVINTATPPTGTQSCVLTDVAKDGATVTITVTPNTGTTYTSVTVTAAAGTTYSRALGTPTVVNAGSGSVTATFTADGFSTLYNVTSANTVGAANKTCQVYNYTTAPTGTQSCTVTGLTNGVYYTFTVAPATNTYSTVSLASSATLVGVNFAATPTAVWAADGAATVAFTSDGVASTYVVTATDTTTVGNGGQTCVVANSTTAPAKGAQSCTVTGLTDGDSYTFSVTPSGNGTTLTMSLPSAAFVPSKSVAPFAPTAVTSVVTATTVAVTWVAPTNTGGSAITGYVVTGTAGNVTVSCGTVAATATTCTLSGLTASTAYALSVTAVNAKGSSPAAVGTATTLAAVTPPPVSKAPHFGSFSGTPARIGKTVTFTINGSNLSGTSVKSSNGHTTLHVVSHTGSQIKVKVTVSKAQKSNGIAKLTIAGANGKLVLTYSIKK
jgi:hypothetical protein